MLSLIKTPCVEIGNRMLILYYIIFIFLIFIFESCFNMRSLCEIGWLGNRSLWVISTHFGKAFTLNQSRKKVWKARRSQKFVSNFKFCVWAVVSKRAKDLTLDFLCSAIDSALKHKTDQNLVLLSEFVHLPAAVGEKYAYSIWVAQEEIHWGRI